MCDGTRRESRIVRRAVQNAKTNGIGKCVLSVSGDGEGDLNGASYPIVDCASSDGPQIAGTITIRKFPTHLEARMNLALPTDIYL